MTKQELLSMEEYEILDYLREHDVNVCTDIDEELNLWFEYMHQKGYSFIDCINWIASEEYFDGDKRYYTLDTVDYIYPKCEYGYNNIEEIIDDYEDYLDLDEEELEEEQEI